MSPELEVLDQLQGGDLPLSVVSALFPDETQARRALGALLAEGSVALLAADGQPVPTWQLGELARQSRSWRTDSRYRLALTDAGARKLEG